MKDFIKVCLKWSEVAKLSKKFRAMTFAEKVLTFYKGLNIEQPLPHGVEVMNPYRAPECLEVCKHFYSTFYNDYKKRFLILGINPGRYGAGITGIPFTDPIKLERLFGIRNELQKKPELSAEFIHRMIIAFGGYEKFFGSFFINSVSPLGFVQNGKNLNYYDVPALKQALDPFIRKSMRNLLALGIRQDIAFCLGEGENFRHVGKLNAEEKWFNELIPLAHPRFILQYKRKHVNEYIADYIGKLTQAVERGNAL